MNLRLYQDEKAITMLRGKKSKLLFVFAYISVHISKIPISSKTKVVESENDLFKH